MSDIRFARAAALVHALGGVDLGVQGTLAAALRIGLPFSLWDVVATTLLMYRFPVLFSASGAPVPPALALRLRPYRGLMARAQDRLTRPARSASGIGRWPREARAVICLGFVENFVRDVLQPVGARLAQAGTPVVVLRERPAQGAVTDGSLAHNIWEHWDARAEQRHAELRRRLREVARAVFGAAGRARLRDAVRARFGDVGVEYDLRWLFWRELPRLLPRVAVAEGIIARHAPALVVSADDADPRARIYAYLAKAAGVPSLLVQQGLSRRDVPEFEFLAYDHVAAMGPSSMDDMVGQGVPADRIVVTGPAGFDEMAGGAADAGLVRDELGVPAGVPMILFASQPAVPGAFRDTAARAEMIRAVGRIGADETRILVVKPHPGERTEDLTALLGARRGVRVVDRSRNIAPLIRACDVFVTFFSTAALQALYAGKPVINLDFAGDEGVRMYAESAATWVARNTMELDAHLDQLLGGQVREATAGRAAARHRFLSAYVHHADGQAAARIGEVARSLMATSVGVTCA